MPENKAGTRLVAIVGPGGAGKTSLAESLLFACRAISRQGSVAAGNTVGDASPEARARGGSTEINLFNLEFLGDRFALIDCPGSVGFSADGALGIAAADIAVVVVDPEPGRAHLAEPVLRQLDALGIPHAIFVNKIDAARGNIQDILEGLQPMSAAPLIARQIPIREGHGIAGFVDLALERAFHYRAGKPSERMEIPAELAAVEKEARFHMLEQLSDHDDQLLEQLLMDETPDLQTVLADLARETRENWGVPVLFGSALNGWGVRRLLKALRHEAPPPEQAAERLGTGEQCAFVFKVSHGGAVGRVAYARVFGGTLREGAELKGPDGAPTRVGTLFAIQGDKLTKLTEAGQGDVVAIAKAEAVKAGQWLGSGPATALAVERPALNYALAISTRDRKDDVRLSAALNKLVEEDRTLEWEQDEALHETRIKGVSDEHLKVTIDRLKRRFGVAIDTRAPTVGYKESIRKAVTQRGRHKKQSGGHGQFGDVVIELKPLPRGSGFQFDERITGGAVPRQYIPAVEQGVRDAMLKGPLGFPVVDVAVTLTDGSYHTVDSSELAFRTAGRIAMAEALAAAAPHLLEPVQKVTIHCPNSATSRVTSAVSSRRGQMLGMGPREGWERWDQIQVLMPESELQGLDAELRSLSQGLASYRAEFDHLAELNGKLADEVVHKVLEPA
jgi:elongation factor G